jgi:hypothetical protein
MSSKKRNKINRRKNNTPSYETLEERRVLATLLGYDGAGGLTVQITSNDDAAVIDVASNGNVTVNGSQDLSTTELGTQSANFADLRSVTVTGGLGIVRQAATFNGDFSNANGANLQSINVTRVGDVHFNGNYELAGNLNVEMDLVSGIVSGGSLNDNATGQIKVNGTTNIVANNGQVLLDNAANDFVGAVDVTSDNSVTMRDVNDIQFSDVTLGGSLIVTAGGTVSDATDSNINVAQDGRFVAENILLGDTANDVVNFNRFNATATDRIELSEDSTVILLDIDTDYLVVKTQQGIYDGRTTDINVRQVATFEASSQIRIGENGTDTFNAGSVNFKSSGHVHIWEDGVMSLSSANTASTVDLFSNNGIYDGGVASLNVIGQAGFQSGGDIILGDTATDEINVGSVHFFTLGDFNYSEDSDIFIVETKNQARRMFLSTDFEILDADNARINVERIASFDADRVNVGDQSTDQFNAGSVTFRTDGQFRLFENSDLNISGFNSADSTQINSTGDITAEFLSANDEGARLEVATVGAFDGQNITLGTGLNDLFQFGAVQLNTPGVATVAEDSDMLITGSSTVGELNLMSPGAINDSSVSQLNVFGIANLTADSVMLGDFADDVFNAQSVTVNVTNNVMITENSGLNLDGTNRAGSMNLIANGTVTDSLAADTIVTGNFNASGTLINLGSQATDNLEIGSLTFNSTLNTNVTTDSGIFLFGDSFAGDQLLLTADGNIFDDANASTRVQNRADFEGIDVVIGETATDCFDILSGGADDVTVVTSGQFNSFTLGCPS